MTSLSPSHLDVIERRFLAMTAGPQPLTLDCAALGCGLPNEELPLDRVRVLLLKRHTSWVSKDAVWHEPVRKAHAAPEPWTTIAAAMMMPGLSLLDRLAVVHTGLDRTGVDASQHPVSLHHTIVGQQGGPVTALGTAQRPAH